MRYMGRWTRCVLFLAVMTALLLSQTLWPLLIGAALGQGTDNGASRTVAPVDAVCGPELQQLCSGVQRGQGRLIECLGGHTEGLSPVCKTFVMQALLGCVPEQGRNIQCVKPFDTDPGIKRFDRVNYVLFNQATASTANLLVFLPGTGGKPPGPRGFLRAAADAGYRVISLDYNDEPAVNVYCAKKSTTCSANFRRMRIFGEGISIDASLDNSSAESIVNGLVRLLAYLDGKEPQQGWAGYLDNGAPNWRRIVLAGQSQGAGMAAFIAKTKFVARVILFSSPWDFFAPPGKPRVLALWLAKPAVTPPERWFGGYHQREIEADLLAKSYAALRIPSQNIRVFTGALQPLQSGTKDDNPFHGEGLSNPAYQQDRAFFLGRSP